jgi:hypothetical protein
MSQLARRPALARGQDRREGVYQGREQKSPRRMRPGASGIITIDAMNDGGAERLEGSTASYDARANLLA